MCQDKVAPLGGSENPFLCLVKSSIWTHKITDTLAVSTVHDIVCLNTFMVNPHNCR